MKSKIIHASKMFESHIRMQIIASLYREDLSYKNLKAICECTDGNMTTHTSKLIQSGIITAHKQFANNRPLTTYHLTDEGRESFGEYIETVNELWNQANDIEGALEAS